MRRTLSLVLVLAGVAACGSSEKAPAADTAKAAAAPGALAAPMALTEAMMNGTWNGTNMMADKDSVVGHFTAMGSGGAGKLVEEGSKDTVKYTVVLAGDSMTATSEPYNSVGMPKGAPKVTFVSVGRMSGDKLVGTSTLHLASKPDSIVTKGRWEATKAK